MVIISIINTTGTTELTDGRKDKTGNLEYIDPDKLPHQEAFRLESLCVFLEKKKMSSDKGAIIRFWVHKQQAGEVFRNHNILLPDQFKEVYWEMVYSALH